MAGIAAPIRRSIRLFLDAVRQERRIEAAYLYGSQIKGTASEWSDIDLALVSPDFSEDVFRERVALMRIAARVDDRIEPHPFSPQRFEGSDPLVSEIRRTGLRVA